MMKGLILASVLLITTIILFSKSNEQKLDKFNEQKFVESVCQGIRGLIERLDTTGEMSGEKIKNKIIELTPAFKEDKMFNDFFPIIFKLYKLEGSKKKIEK